MTRARLALCAAVSAVLGSSALGSAAVGATGCAFMSKSEPLSTRYFSPVNRAEVSRAGAAQADVEVRLGQIESAAHLEERIAYRMSETELGYYEHLRWTEPPDGYLRRELLHELFEVRGVRRVVSGAGAALDVELVSFEEVREGKPRARVGLRLSLRDDRRSLLERALVVEEPLDNEALDDTGRALAEAMAAALTRAVDEVADQVIGHLDASNADLTKQGAAGDL